MRVAGFDRSLARLRDVLAFLVFGAFAGPAAGVLVRLALVWVQGAAIWPDRPMAVWVAGLGEAVGILVVAPAIWTWLARTAPLAPARRVEVAAMAVTTLAVAGFVFAGHSTPMMAVEPLPYAVFPPLFWAALRFGNREAATALARGRRHRGLVHGATRWDRSAPATCSATSARSTCSSGWRRCPPC